MSNVVLAKADGVTAGWLAGTFVQNITNGTFHLANIVREHTMCVCVCARAMQCSDTIRWVGQLAPMLSSFACRSMVAYSCRNIHGCHLASTHTQSPRTHPSCSAPERRAKEFWERAVLIRMKDERASWLTECLHFRFEIYDDYWHN